MVSRQSPFVFVRACEREKEKKTGEMLRKKSTSFALEISFAVVDCNYSYDKTKLLIAQSDYFML